MPSPVAVWSFWIAVCACAAGQIAILRDMVISRRGSVPQSGTEPHGTASPAPSTDAAGSATPSLAGHRPGNLHTAGEVMWAALPGIALIFVLLWTWRVIHAGR